MGGGCVVKWTWPNQEYILKAGVSEEMPGGVQSLQIFLITFLTEHLKYKHSFLYVGHMISIQPEN